MPEKRTDADKAQDEALFALLRVIHEDPSLSQRDLSRKLGISLGKTNYCVQALLRQGWIKAGNFRNSSNKMAYSYMLTPKGMDRKMQLAMRFLNEKQQEFDVLRREIQLLKDETSTR